MTLVVSTLLIIIVLALIVVYFQNVISFIDFFIMCSTEDISFRASMTMWSVGKRNKQNCSLSEIFEDSSFLNRCILDITRRKVLCREGSKRWDFYVSLLDILYEIRQKLALKVSSSSAISSSLDLPEDSSLTLQVTGLSGASYQSKVLSNDNSGMVISYPVGPKLPLDFSWRGKHVLTCVVVGGISFRFAMTFDPNYWDQSFMTLRLLHSDSFSQEQQRLSVRYNVHVPALFTLLTEEGERPDQNDEAEDPEDSPQTEASSTAEESVSVEAASEEKKDLRSVVKDLSFGGCQILISGTVPANTKCSLLLRLNGQEIPSQGVTRLVNYIESDDFSYVRIQFTYLKHEDLQKICSFIYGIEVTSNEVPPTPQENSNFYAGYQTEEVFPEREATEESDPDYAAAAALHKLDDQPAEEEEMKDDSSEEEQGAEEDLQNLLEDIYKPQDSFKEQELNNG